MFLTVADGVRRFVDGRSIPGTIEITEVALVIVVFLGMLSAETSGSHVRTALFTERIPPRLARWVRVAGRLLALAVVGFLTYVTGVGAAKSVAEGQYQFGLIRIPIWPAKLAVFIGFGLLAIAILSHTVDLIRNRPSAVVGEPAEDPESAAI